MVSESPQVPALYTADIEHARRSPLRHAFTYRASYWLVDFDRLPQLRGAAHWCAQIRARDHMDIRRLVAERGLAATRMVMLTGARNFGYVFNPITIFWCYDENDEISAVVAEVHNTYGERHAYVLEPDPSASTHVPKEMYVSPFNPVDGAYRISVSEPGRHVRVSVTLERPGAEPFVATLRASRQKLTAIAAVRSALRHSGVRTRLLIQWQGLRLWHRGLAVQPR
jgi:DUF1365 family protein